MGGISHDDFTQSVAYREIFGRGEAQAEAPRRSQGDPAPAEPPLRPPIRRCQSGPGRRGRLSPSPRR